MFFPLNTIKTRIFSTDGYFEYFRLGCAMLCPRSSRRNGKKHAEKQSGGPTKTLGDDEEEATKKQISIRMSAYIYIYLFIYLNCIYVSGRFVSLVFGTSSLVSYIMLVYQIEYM